MRTISRILVAAMVSTIVAVVPGTPASAGGRALDSYCSESGDYCTYVVQKDSGAISFEIRAFANYFGRATACITKDTRVCHSRAPHRDKSLYVWRIRWQDNYPDEGSGRYTVRWSGTRVKKIGPALHFTRS